MQNITSQLTTLMEKAVLHHLTGPTNFADISEKICWIS